MMAESSNNEVGFTEDALAIFHAAIAAVQPANLVPQYLELTPEKLRVGDQYFERNEIGSVYVIGAGKASAAMAQATEKILLPVITDGLVITKSDHSLPLDKIRCAEAGHPVPDQSGLEASAEMFRLISNVKEDDIVICLISGGASALLVDTPRGISLADIQGLVKILLASGADIHEINSVRKHLSGIKGGQLARVSGKARLITLILSDVNGDELSVIASGPTVPDPSTFADALGVFEKYRVKDKVPASILQYLTDGVAGKYPETPKPGDPIFGRTTNMLIGTNKVALDAASVEAERRGFHVRIIDDRLEGEASEKADEFVDTCLLYEGPRPACLLMGGETTVTIKGNGKGGRNQHFVLAALHGLQQSGQGFKPGTVPVILSGGTDGTDGPTDAAGAMISAASMELPDVQKYLENNDAWHFFSRHHGVIKTGPTQTNVMDIVVGLLF